MDSSPPDARRTLAAIVFTDVVNFTGRVADQEARMVKLVKRDLDMMSQCCVKFDGRVLKNTGDGLLMYFTSAVRAVQCAMHIQKVFARAEVKLPAQDALKHRIGIHLGDVFLSDDDVMGEGVNIASRLQQTAKPGGICFSQTVYDVVKNRLAVKATYVGPTELKHIREKVPVYQILADAIGAGSDGLKQKRAFIKGRRALLWIGIGAGAAAVLLGGLYLAYQQGRADPIPPNENGLAPPGLPNVGPPDGPHDADRRQNIRDMIRRFDRNGDGQLTRQEVPPPHLANFSGADTNQDGVLTQQELESFQSQGPPGRPERRDSRNPRGPRGTRRPLRRPR